jgi:hypothetical protein
MPGQMPAQEKLAYLVITMAALAGLKSAQRKSLLSANTSTGGSHKKC